MLPFSSPNRIRLSFSAWLNGLWSSRFVPILIATAAFLASNYWSYGKEPLYWDAWHYWTLGQKFFLEDGSFSFVNFGTPFRGYLFPLILAGVQKLSSICPIDGLLLYRILAAVGAGFFTSALIPKVYHKATGRRAGNLQVLLFSGLVLLFWRGYMAYPLSDFPAIACLLLAYVLFPSFQTPSPLNGLRMILAGLCLASATNIRPSFLMVLLLLTAYVVLKSARSWRSLTKPALLRFSLLVAGMAVAFAPQSVLNFVHKDSFSPLIPTNGLYARQLTWGIRYQRYGTNVGTAYPSPELRFIDPVGDAICKMEHIDVETPITYSAYAGLVAKYPFDFIVIYTRHLFNGFDIVYSTPYVKEVQNPRVIFSLANYLLIFIAGAILIQRRSACRANGAMLGLIFVFISPALLSIPGAIEPRFFLPIYLLVYATVSLGLSPQELRMRDSVVWVQRYWLAALCFVLFSFVLSTLTFSTLEHATVLLSLSPGT